MNVEKNKNKMRTTPSCPNQQQQKQKKTTFDRYSLRVMQGVVQLTVEVCAPSSKLSNHLRGELKMSN